MSELYDTVIRGGYVVLKDTVVKLDIGVKDEKIVEIAPNIQSESNSFMDASGLYIMPGMIDVHVHLNEPGLGEWEGFVTGSAALAAGGCTTYLDMPLNGVPPTTRLTALQEKLNAANNRSYVDYAIWGGLVPGNVEHLEHLTKHGVIGFKAFMSSPGGEGEDIFREVDDETLFRGMQEIARLNQVLALHAESETIVSNLTLEKLQVGDYSVQAFLQSRPIVAELEAVQRALYFAELTGCALHFVHISSAQAVQLIDDAKCKGLDVTLETCAHYLTLTEDDMVTKGAVAKCAPPLRSLEEQDKLWLALCEGKIDMISSDHSPCPSVMKQKDNFFEAWGGISGAQHTMELMISEGYNKRQIPLPDIARWLSYNPAKRFGLSSDKGELAVGLDADLVMVNLQQSYTLSEQDLYYKHKHSPYVGRELSCKIVSTMCRGKLVYTWNGLEQSTPQGKWIIKK